MSFTATFTPRHCRTVLIVEDCPLTRMVLSAYAERAGFAPICAGDGLEAAKLLADGLVPDLVVTDIDMPRLDGHALVRLIRESPLHRRTPVIVQSSAPRPADGHGADLWLGKGDAETVAAALQTFGTIASMEL
jgi:CheY-like chemotaxis protein